MSLKQEIETWMTALTHYDNNEFDESLHAFVSIADTSKILFNCGVIHATLGQHAQAVECYQRAVQLDQYLAIAYFQQGVSNFLLGDFEEALANFNDTLLYLRGNKWIDYEQLGLKFKLHSCEALFNRGLCYIYLQQRDAGLQDLLFAAKEKAVPDHDVIDEAIREQAEGYTVFSIPVGLVYRPNEAKVKNLKTKHYLGKARLVAAQDTDNITPGHRRNLSATNFTSNDVPQEKLSYAAMNLVRPGISSRSRQQSEPPVHRNVFPPTPPPELERPSSAASKRRSTGSTTSAPSGLNQARPGATKPQRLDLGTAAFDHRSYEKPRLGTVRSASEHPPRRRDEQSSMQRLPDTRFQDRRSWREDQQQLRADIYREPVLEPQQLQPVSYHRRSVSRNPTATQHQRPVSIEEEDETTTADESTTSTSPLAFEIIPPRSYRNRSASRQGSRRPDVRKIRVKVHGEDTRYVMISTSASFVEFAEQIRQKFGIRGDFKLKLRDEEGDMVMVGDQEDLEMAISTTKSTARRERAEVGKLEVSAII
ncbi:hypothetical protein MBLNU459_g2099t1 [Dothideomycetes sp. NU459]